ncbi:MAG: hypothetical protein QM692_12760 [Thermomicrobiales bacterium]
MSTRARDILALALPLRTSRRRFGAALTALPSLGGLLALLGADDSQAGGRRKRRKKRHKHGKTRRRDHRRRKQKKPAVCPAGQAACAGDCADLQGDRANCGVCGVACGGGQVCQSGVCSIPCGGAFCPAATSLCVAGACVACDVTCAAANHSCDSAALQAALNTGGTVHVCPGVYTGTFTIPAATPTTVIGAGMDDDPVANTILDARQAGRTLTLHASATLRGLRIRGGTGCGGAGLATLAEVALTVEQCAIVDNHEDSLSCTGGGVFLLGGTTTIRNSLVSQNSSGVNGGGIVTNSGDLILRATEVRANTALRGGGVYVNGGTFSLLDGSAITGNTATNVGGGIRTAGGETVTIGADSSVTLNTPDNCSIGGTLIGVCGA